MTALTAALNISETGRRAFAAGLKVKDCPFAIRSSARMWWLKGYREAKAEAEESTIAYMERTLGKLLS